MLNLDNVVKTLEEHLSPLRGKMIPTLLISHSGYPVTIHGFLDDKITYSEKWFRVILFPESDKLRVASQWASPEVGWYTLSGEPMTPKELARAILWWADPFEH